MTFQPVTTSGSRARSRSASRARSACSVETLVTVGASRGGPTKMTSPGPPWPARETAVTLPARSVSMSRASQPRGGTAWAGLSDGLVKTRFNSPARRRLSSMISRPGDPQGEEGVGGAGPVEGLGGDAGGGEAAGGVLGGAGGEGEAGQGGAGEVAPGLGVEGGAVAPGEEVERPGAGLRRHEEGGGRRGEEEGEGAAVVEAAGGEHAARCRLVLAALLPGGDDEAGGLGHGALSTAGEESTDWR